MDNKPNELGTQSTTTVWMDNRAWDFVEGYGTNHGDTDTVTTMTTTKRTNNEYPYDDNEDDVDDNDDDEQDRTHDERDIDAVAEAILGEGEGEARLGRRGRKGNSSARRRRQGWTTVVPVTGSTPPCRRSLHAAAVCGDALYVFGGYDGRCRRNDLHRYHFPTNQWTELPFYARGGGTWPDPRDRHTAVVHADRFLYVFGGFVDNSSHSHSHSHNHNHNHNYNHNHGSANGNHTSPLVVGTVTGRTDELWICDLTTGRWWPEHEHLVAQQQQQQQQHFSSGSARYRQGALLPTPRHSHAAVVHNDETMVVFGGYDGGYRNDVWALDFVQRTFWEPQTSGRPPVPRYRAAAAVHGDTLIVCGGHDGARHLSDVYLLNVRRWTWTSLQFTGPETLRLRPRDSHTAVVYRDGLYVFGGSHAGAAMDDLYHLSLPERTTTTTMTMTTTTTTRHRSHYGDESPMAEWKQIGGSDVGSPGHRFCHVAAVYDSSMYVFGGYDGSERLNDFVRLDLREVNNHTPHCSSGAHSKGLQSSSSSSSSRHPIVPRSTFTEELRSWVDDPTLSDVTVVVEGRPVHAHRIFLVRSPYFRAMLTGDHGMREQSSHNPTQPGLVVEVEEVRHAVFLQVLDFLYTDRLRLRQPPQQESNSSSSSTTSTWTDLVMELLVAADRFCLSRLLGLCERALLASLKEESAATLLYLADLHSHSSPTLRQGALTYVKTHITTVSKTPAFEEMARANVELVLEVLRNNDKDDNTHNHYDHHNEDANHKGVVSSG